MTAMTESTHDKVVRWISDYIRVYGDAKLDIRDIRRSMRVAGETTLSCYLLDNKFLFGSLVHEAKKLSHASKS